MGRIAAMAFGCLALANCSSSKLSSKVDPRLGVSASPRVVGPGEPVPKGGGYYRVGAPYVVGGRRYVPSENRHYRAEGTASWYGDDFHGRLTANGEVFDMASITAAHPTMPLPSYARVTNLSNHRSLIVRVNDRGPYHSNRVIDVSAAAAELLGFRWHGVTRVRVEYVGPAPLSGSNDEQLAATLRENGPASLPSAVRLASARGFVPRLPNPARGEAAPMPPDRPYDLGRAEADARDSVPAPRSARTAPDPAETQPSEGHPRLVWREGPPPAVIPSRASAYAPRQGFSANSLY